MNQRIEELKREMEQAGKDGGDWRSAYELLMKEVYGQPVLYFALSRTEYDPVTATSKPLVSTKDFNGQPSLYVFSDGDLAFNWMNHYRHVTDDGHGLIGMVENAGYGLYGVFTMAAHLGVQMIMLDEGGDYVGISLKDFLKANETDPRDMTVMLSQEELERLKQGGQPDVGFTRIRAMKLKL